MRTIYIAIILTVFIGVSCQSDTTGETKPMVRVVTKPAKPKSPTMDEVLAQTKPYVNPLIRIPQSNDFSLQIDESIKKMPVHWGQVPGYTYSPNSGSVLDFGKQTKHTVSVTAPNGDTSSFSIIREARSLYNFRLSDATSKSRIRRNRTIWISSKKLREGYATATWSLPTLAKSIPESGHTFDFRNKKKQPIEVTFADQSKKTYWVRIYTPNVKNPEIKRLPQKSVNSLALSEIKTTTLALEKTQIETENIEVLPKEAIVEKKEAPKTKTLSSYMSLGMNDYKFKSTNKTTDTKPSVGYQVGGLFTHNTLNFMSTNLGLGLGMRSGEMTEGEQISSLNTYHVELPAYIQFKTDQWTKAFKPYLNLGAKVSYAFTGSVQNSLTNSGQGLSSGDINFGANNQIDRVEGMLVLGMGIERSNYLIGINYEYGLNDVGVGTARDISAQVIMLSFVYNLSGWK